MRPLVHVEVGPFPAASAHAWLKYARSVLDEARSGGEVSLPPDVLTEFGRYLDEWDAAAAAGASFRWEGEADAEVVEYLLHAWFNLARALSQRAEARGVKVTPPEGELFYNGLVRALLDALAEQGRGGTSFAEELRTDWPGLGQES